MRGRRGLIGNLRWLNDGQRESELGRDGGRVRGAHVGAPESTAIISVHVLLVVRRITDTAILLMADASHAEGFVEYGVVPRGFARVRCGACGSFASASFARR